MLHRAYSLFTVKSIDEEQRIIEGIATTPEPDRLGDVVVSEGAKFRLPLPLLWQHDSKQPIGHVTHASVTSDGIPVRAKILQIAEPGKLKDRLDEAWQSIKHGLVRGLSIGFTPIGDPEPIKNTFSLKFPAWEWLELSAVTIPANSSASISAIKSIAAQDLAASGTGSDGVVRSSPGVAGHVVVTARKGAKAMKKTIQEQIKDYEATRQAKAERRSEIMSASAESGTTLDAAQAEEYETLDGDIKAIDTHLKRLRDLETENVAAARPAASTPTHEPTVGRSPVITVHQNLPAGLGFIRAIGCKLASFLSQGAVNPIEVAKQRYPDDPRIQAYLKVAVPAGTTTHADWASALVDQTTLASEFVEFLRPQTILGKFGTNGIPSLRRVPFNIRFVNQTTGGNAWWVGQGAPKPLTAFSFGSDTLLWSKIATIAVITRELARFSSPSAELLVRDQLAAALRDQLDRDFVDPSTAAVTNVSPASITNGLTALSSAGTSADNARTDLQNLLEQFILQNINPASLVLIMPNTLALALSLLRNSLGQKEFPDITLNGGFLEGIPVITSQHAANQSGSGNMVIAVNANDVFLADDGQVTVEASTEASLEMLDNPTNSSATPTPTTSVSMFQTNSIALLAERFINWKVARTGAVSYMDDVNWGSIGSPS